MVHLAVTCIIWILLVLLVAHAQAVGATQSVQRKETRRLEASQPLA